MNPAEISAVERVLGITLPDYYRKAAASGLLSGILNSNSQSVIAINHAFRNGDFGDADWPNHLFAFGDDGGGNFYCLDLSSEDDRVLIRDHETLELKTEANSFSNWIRSTA